MCQDLVMYLTGFVGHLYIVWAYRWFLGSYVLCLIYTIILFQNNLHSTVKGGPDEKGGGDLLTFIQI